MIIINYLNQKLREYVSENFSILDFNIEIVKTKKEFDGLYTIVLFPLNQINITYIPLLTPKNISIKQIKKYRYKFIFMIYIF